MCEGGGGGGGLNCVLSVHVCVFVCGCVGVSVMSIYNFDKVKLIHQSIMDKGTSTHTVYQCKLVNRNCLYGLPHVIISMLTALNEYCIVPATVLRMSM